MKFKKYVFVLILFLLFGCSTSTSNSQDKAEIALITDIGTIDDHSFNQESWEGIVDFASRNNVTYKYYRPENKDDNAFYNEIEKAITEGGARVVVLPGFYFEATAAKVQDDFPDVNFILIDAMPKKADTGDQTIKKNLVPVLFKEEQASYLAGYVAALEGYTKVGFVGGAKIPSVERYGMGFLKGLQDGAAMKNQTIHIKYKYTGSFEPSTEIQMLGASWYNEGTEIIFASAGGAGQSIIKAAEDTQKQFIGVDVDQSYISETVVFSATKGIRKTVTDLLEAIQNKSFPGGEVLTVDLNRDGVGVELSYERLKHVTKEEFNELVETTQERLNKQTLEIETEHDEFGLEFKESTAYPNLKIDFYR